MLKAMQTKKNNVYNNDELNHNYPGTHNYFEKNCNFLALITFT